MTGGHMVLDLSINAKAQEASQELLESIEKPKSLDERLKALEALGKHDLVETFKKWQPRKSRARQRGAPLDQRVSITVTTEERISLDRELKALKESSQRISMSNFIRNKAIGNIDIMGWRDIALKEIPEIERIHMQEGDLRKRRLSIIAELDEEDMDGETARLLQRDLADINASLRKVNAQNEKRSNRLSGRMTTAEAETVKWRAQQLKISTSDYLRMILFDLEPASSGDAHMSFEAKMAFYISILNVADNGWGSPPTIYQCRQCESYLDEIQRLRQEIRILEDF